jgi:adenylate cyclase
VKKISYRKVLFILIMSFLYTMAAYLGLFNRIDKWIQDDILLHPQALTGDVVVIGIDDNSLERLGPYNTWDRNVMASALWKLSEDPSSVPAVVAIDTLYSGTTDPAADANLVDAAASLPKVITASAAEFGSDFVAEGNGSFSRQDHLVLSYEEPFEDLKAVSTQGHINAMYDLDGVLRHALLYFDVDGKRVYSMAWETAKAFAESNGQELTLPDTDKRGHYYLSYSALPGTYYDGWNIADLIEGKIPSDYYAGKIVFLGPYCVGLQDEYFTTIDQAKKMYGVEVQANAVEAFLRSDYKTEMPDWIQALITFVVLAALLTIFLRLKLTPSSIVAGVVCVLTFGMAYVLYVNGTIVHPLWLPLGALCMYVCAIAIHYVRAYLERVRVTRTFERYVAPEIVGEILKEGIENLSLGGKNCDIAVLFVDVRRFTTMSERLTPEKVVYILNKYLTMASDCVERNKGTLDKFVGDAMMAFWGAPLPQEDAIYNAVRTAVDIIEGAARVSDELKAEIGEELRVGVGVNYGPAIVGNMGAEKHMDYTAIGDTVNTAARLEANAPGGCIYVSRAVVDGLGDRITVESLGSTVKLKGKAEGFEVLKVLELK